MHRPRLIPVLLLSNGRLVKTRQFKDPVYVGDPLNVVRIFNDKEVDELFVLDIDASKLGQEPDYALIEALASQCAMPLCVGGGIKTTQQAQRMYSLGVEKISVQTACFTDTTLLRRLSDQFGAQAIVASIDIKASKLGGYKMFSAARKKVMGRDWVEHTNWAINEGAGEILLTSVDREGSMRGVDLRLIEKASKFVDVPLVVHGGVGSLRDVNSALAAGADAVAAGSFLVFHQPHKAVLISYPSDALLGVSRNE